MAAVNSPNRRVRIDFKQVEPADAARALGAAVDIVASDAGANTDELDIIDEAITELCELIGTSALSVELGGAENSLWVEIEHGEIGAQLHLAPVIAAAFPSIAEQKRTSILRRQFAPASLGSR